MPNDGAQTQVELKQLNQGLAAADDIASVSPATFSEDGEIATIFLTPATSPRDKETSDLLANLRENVIPEATADSGIEILVSGSRNPETADG